QHVVAGDHVHPHARSVDGDFPSDACAAQAGGIALDLIGHAGKGGGGERDCKKDDHTLHGVLMLSFAPLLAVFPQEIEPLRRSPLRTFRLLVLPLILTIASSAFGSGFALFEAGAKAVAMGGAFAATADDPSAIFYNVAGLAQQRRGEILFGGTVINFQNQFTGDPNDLYTAGSTGKYRAHTFEIG